MDHPHRQIQTGTSREIWKADEGQGSVFRDVVSEINLLVADNHVVFPGRRMVDTLYPSRPLDRQAESDSADSRRVEVEHVSMSSDGNQIVYSSNQGDIDRRHIWRVTPSARRAPEAITSGNVLSGLRSCE